MRFQVAALWGVASLFLPAPGVCAAEFLLDEADSALVRVVVKTASGDSEGSGFFVDERHVVTNRHVIARAMSLSDAAELLVIPDGSEAELPVSVVREDERLDLAVLLMAGRTSHGALGLAGGTPRQLTRVFALGYPRAARSVAVGPVRSTPMPGFLNGEYEARWREHLGTVRLLQHTADLYPGNSGGPLVDVCGRVLGINTSAGAMEAQVSLNDVDGGDRGRAVRDVAGDRGRSRSFVVAVPAPGISHAVDVEQLMPLLEDVGSSYRVVPACEGSGATGAVSGPHAFAIVSLIVILLALAVLRFGRLPRALPRRAAERGAASRRRYWIGGSVLVAAMAVVATAVVERQPPGPAEESIARVYSRILGREWSAFRQDENGLTDLHYAAALNLPGVVRGLLDAGARVDARMPRDGEFFGDGAERVLGLGAVAQRRNGQTPLHMAARFNAGHAVGALVERGADFLAVDEEGNSALHLAVRRNAADALTELLERGADVDARNRELATALHVAALFGQLESMRVLLEWGADVAATDGRGETPLHRAATGHADGARLLMDHGADAQARADWGITPLHVAADWGASDVARALIGRGADVHARDGNSRTPLFEAASAYPSLGVVELLLEHGANVRDEDEASDTPLPRSRGGDELPGRRVASGGRRGHSCQELVGRYAVACSGASGFIRNRPFASGGRCESARPKQSRGDAAASRRGERRRDGHRSVAPRAWRRCQRQKRRG